MLSSPVVQNLMFLSSTSTMSEWIHTVQNIFLQIVLYLSMCLNIHRIETFPSQITIFYFILYRYPFSTYFQTELKLLNTMLMHIWLYTSVRTDQEDQKKLSINQINVFVSMYFETIWKIKTNTIFVYNKATKSVFAFVSI